MDSGSVPGNSKMYLWYETAFQGRQNGHMIEEPLQTLLEVEGDVFAAHETLFDGFGDFGLYLLDFLVFPFRFVRFFVVPGSREQFISGV